MQAGSVYGRGRKTHRKISSESRQVRPRRQVAQCREVQVQAERQAGKYGRGETNPLAGVCRQAENAVVAGRQAGAVV